MNAVAMARTAREIRARTYTGLVGNGGEARKLAGHDTAKCQEWVSLVIKA